MMRKDPNLYPKGLNREKVKAIIDYYENQSDADAIAEGEAAFYRRPKTSKKSRKDEPRMSGTKREMKEKIRLTNSRQTSFLMPNHWRSLA
jgi:stress response protein YsnF